MPAGFEARNHSTAAATGQPEAMFTIQALAATGWGDVQLEMAVAALTATYAAAVDELTTRVTAARAQRN